VLPIMATINVDQLTAFVAIVRAGSFTGAAKALGTQKAHLSRSISRLEKHFGVQLFQRSTRALAVTEIGRDLYERATTILAAIEDTAVTIQNTHQEPQGVLRLTCGVEFGLLVVSGWITSYLRKYPNVRVDVEYSNRLADIIHEGFDLAVRVGPLADSSLAARRLGEIHYALYASPDYLKVRSAPVDPSELADHDLILFAVSRPAVWHLFKGTERFDVNLAARLVLDNNISARDAAAAGLGITLLPCFMAAPLVKQGKLVVVLKGWTRSSAPIHAVFASSRYLTPKVRAFIDLARADMPALRAEL
jgi:LysR family transcriptional regulator, regulator for bpeEF and oprC